MAARKPTKTKRPQQLRIIGGRWRSRRLSFPDVEGLRPTPDRVRETLFNWLAPVIEGARCLDLFAGSGALGLEALSRGAVEVVMVDRDPQVIARLKENVATLSAPGATIVAADALPWLQSPHQKSTFDIVFLDPPFGQDLLEPCSKLLEERGWLTPSAYIYLESESVLGLPSLPDHWRLKRSQKAGQVGYHLATREGATTT
ncbi:MAG TPA: 16S rRNA (guanine(966)-N(2))-methyltransferase RsmD [Gammaproteobacteria bacterium]|nr:16S rRNA (guanine(966)-N(2))-methyltransferase RsmD [Gammaproteobacteria bacterium]